MDAVTVLRNQFQFVHWILGETVGDVTSEQALQAPPGRAANIAAQYAHAIAAEDAVVQGLIGGRAPLMANNWAGRTGLPSPVPMDGTWDEWAKTAQIDFAQLREYGQAVRAATDEVVAGLSDADLDREVDMSEIGMGMQTVGGVLAMFAAHAAMHAGEIATIKGVAGAKGYPV